MLFLEDILMKYLKTMMQRMALVALCAFGMQLISWAGTLKLSVHEETKDDGNIMILIYRLDHYPSGKVIGLTKEDIYGKRKPDTVLVAQKTGVYTINALRPGSYSVVAYRDVNHDRKISFDPPEPMGWVQDQSGKRFAIMGMKDQESVEAELTLRKPVPFTNEIRHTDHGTLKHIHGLPVLQLSGTAEERGFAHGYLVGEQILDFFEFYLLEDSWRSPKRYETVFVPFLEHRLSVPEEYMVECKAVIRGMKAAGTDMFVPALGRDFSLTDLLAINAYIERRATVPGPVPSTCSQFAFWGPLSGVGENGGGLVAARNMDGECDIRKVTVSHFLLFAIDPAEQGQKRWVSAMWPGFVGTISGINEEGVYSMENAGGSGPGPIPGKVVPCAFIQRNLLEHSGAEITPEQVMDRMSAFAGTGGGITAAGSIILWASPYRGQPAPAFVFEGSRTGSAIRKPWEKAPENPYDIMATNHHLVLGYNPEQPNYSLGVPVSLSSLWRYEAGKEKLKAWERQNKLLDIESAKELLQTVAHGTTEYSVIFSANEMKILIAVDDLKTDLWDAPYQPWITYSFEELFTP